MKHCIYIVLLLAVVLLPSCSDPAPPPPPPEPAPVPVEEAPSPPAETVQEATLPEEALNALAVYEFGQDRTALSTVEAAVRAANGNPALAEQLETALVAQLEGSATVDAKRFICRQLVSLGSARSVPVLETLLADETVAPTALWALEHIPANEAEAVLTKTATDATGTVQIGAIQALGRRGAQGPLCALLDSDDIEVAKEAALALSKVPTVVSATCIVEKGETASDELRVALNDAALSMADAFGQVMPDKAMVVYEALLQPENPEHVRSAALRGAVLLEPDTALDRVLAALKDADADFSHTAIGFIGELPGEEATKAFAGLLADLGGTEQARLIDALRVRGDAAALPAVLALTGSEEESVQIAVVQALGALGNASNAAQLAQLATGDVVAVARLARISLDQLTGDDVNGVLAGLAQQADTPAQRIEAINALQRRSATDQKAVLMALTADDDDDVRDAVYTALRGLGAEEDLPALLALLTEKAGTDDRGGLQSAIAGIVSRTGDANALVPTLGEQYAASSDSAERTALLEILGQLPSPASLDLLKGAVADADQDIAMSAIEQLSAWPDNAPFLVLWECVLNSEDDSKRAAAYGGCLRLLRSAQEVPDADLVQAYANMLDQAANDDEVKQLLSGLAGVGSLEALLLVGDCRAKGAVDMEADFATVKIAGRICNAYPEETRAALTPMTAADAPEGLRKMAEAILPRIDCKPEFIRAWLVSGPYTVPGLNGSMMFDEVLPPEENPDAALWKIVPMAQNPDTCWSVNLAKELGGDQRMAFLRSFVWAEAETSAVLLLGSNDGIKAWWNGAQVVANNVGRGVAPDQERVEITLNAGWNDLMLGIYQQGGAWGACARIVDANDQPMSGLKYAVKPAE